MSRVLAISVRFHDGRYHGLPDWPPSPARLFQALLAGVAAAGTLSRESEEAFEWLERLSPCPTIGAPTVREGRGYTSFVPNNDRDSAQFKKAPKIIRSRLFDAEIALLYIWSFDMSDGADALAERICRIAESLYQLGRGVDMAWAWGEVLDETEAAKRLNKYPGTVHRPCDSGSGETLACPEVGSLTSLLARHSAQRKRFTSVVEEKKIQQVFSQPPKSRFRQIAYNSPATLRLYDLIGRLVPWPFVSGAELVACVRDAATKRLLDALPGRKDEVERVLIGRAATEADKSARVRVVPLPSIGHRQADRAIRRLLVEIPPDCPIRPEDVAWAFSGLAPEIDKDTGEVLLGLVSATDSKMLGHYGVDGNRAHRRWWTVTPAVLPESAARRRIDPRRMREEAKGGAERVAEQNRAASAVLQTLRHAGIRGRVETVRVQREPFEAKGARAEVFAAGTRFAKERLWHVEIGFAGPVSGPLIVGDGRYMGLGLMAPVHATPDVDGLYCFSIVAGLTESANAADCSRALRRAVMARVQAAVGHRNKLPTFFTGHESDGAPARNGTHSHLAFATDLARNRLLVIAPHVLERRSPSNDERRYLETLDAAINDLVDLRAGSSGRLELAPLLVDLCDDALFAVAQRWESVTEYRLTRHSKRATAKDALVSDVRSEIRRLGIATPTNVEVVELHEGPRGGLSGRLRLHFATAVGGLILVGRTRHVGGGLFSVA